jgi:hypothetical protein
VNKIALLSLITLHSLHGVAAEMCESERKVCTAKCEKSSNMAMKAHMQNTPAPSTGVSVQQMMQQQQRLENIMAKAQQCNDTCFKTEERCSEREATELKK